MMSVWDGEVSTSSMVGNKPNEQAASGGVRDGNTSTSLQALGQRKVSQGMYGSTTPSSYTWSDNGIQLI